MESRGFSQRTRAAGMTDDELRELQNDIMRGGGVTMPGTGGFRKIRCRATGRGKSGGWRVIFADYPELGLVALIAAYEKSAKADLTGAEKAALAARKRMLDREMEWIHGRKDILRGPA